MNMNRARHGSRIALTTLALAATVAIAGGASPALLAPAAQAAPAAPRERARTQNVSEQKAEPIDINTADLETLVTLPGVGRAIAQRILDYRKEHGPFKKVEDLLNVRGIGDRSLANIRDKVTVSAKS